MHGLNEVYIAPYTDIEFQLAKCQTYIIIKSQDKRYNWYLKKNIIDKDKPCKTDGIKTIFHNRIKTWLYNKKAA